MAGVGVWARQRAHDRRERRGLQAQGCGHPTVREPAGLHPRNPRCSLTARRCCDRTRQTLPSGSKRWFACPGSPVLEAPIPNKSSTWRRRHRNAHVAALCLTEHWRARRSTWVRTSRSTAGTKSRASSSSPTTGRTRAGIRRDTTAQDRHRHRMLVETRVDFSEFVQIEGQLGTADRIIVDLGRAARRTTSRPATRR